MASGAQIKRAAKKVSGRPMFVFCVTVRYDHHILIACHPSQPIDMKPAKRNRFEKAKVASAHPIFTPPLFEASIISIARPELSSSLY